MKKQSSDIKYLEPLRKELQFSDRGIFEKTVYAFSLLKVAFARIAYMASVLKNKNKKSFIKTVDLLLIKDVIFPEKHKILERLKAINPEAYFYWALTSG